MRVAGRHGVNRLARRQCGKLLLGVLPQRERSDRGLLLARAFLTRNLDCRGHVVRDETGDPAFRASDVELQPTNQMRLAVQLFQHHDNAAAW